MNVITLELYRMKDTPDWPKLTQSVIGKHVGNTILKKTLDENIAFIPFFLSFLFHIIPYCNVN